MPRGGYRTRAGRPRGAITRARRDIVRRLEEMQEPDLLVAIAEVMEDRDAPYRTRAEAAFMLSGVAIGRLNLEQFAHTAQSYIRKERNR